MERFLTTDSSDIHGLKIMEFIRCANAGFVVQKTLTSALADAFSQHLPAWRPSATPSFLPKISDEAS